jgi:hypothetical protein
MGGAAVRAADAARCSAWSCRRAREADGPLPAEQHVDQCDSEGELSDAEGGAQVLGAEELGEPDPDGERRHDDGELCEQGA